MTKTLDQTLAEQLKLTDREIAYRKKLFGLTDEDETLLLDSKPIFAPRVNEIVEQFYAEQTSFPEIALLIGDKDSLERLKAAMRRYILDLFDGSYMADYVNRRLRIGLVHKRIGVFPSLYMSGVRLLLSLLVTELKHYRDMDLVDLRISALQKILLFDSHLIFDTFLSSITTELNNAKENLEVYAIGLEEKIEERTRQLKELSMTDELTGLYNQRSFYDHLRRELSLAERVHHPVTLMYFDLNGFKMLNDTQGHVAGDRILSTVGRITKTVVRDSDIACRYGGDEFAIIMPRCSIDNAKVVAARLCDTFDDADNNGVSISIGILEGCHDQGLDADSFVKLADQAMYEAKAMSKIDPGHHIHIGRVDEQVTEPEAPADTKKLATIG